MVAYIPIIPLEDPDMNIQFQSNALYYGDCLNIVVDFRITELGYLTPMEFAGKTWLNFTDFPV